MCCAACVVSYRCLELYKCFFLLRFLCRFFASKKQQVTTGQHTTKKRERKRGNDLVILGEKKKKNVPFVIFFLIYFFELGPLKSNPCIHVALPSCTTPVNRPSSYYYRLPFFPFFFFPFFPFFEFDLLSPPSSSLSRCAFAAASNFSKSLCDTTPP